jgi:hypothetical protein
VFDELCGHFPQGGNYNSLLSYFHDTYICDIQLPNQGVALPKFLSAFWNHNESALNCVARTTNPMEGFNNALNGMFICAHPIL